MPTLSYSDIRWEAVKGNPKIEGFFLDGKLFIKTANRAIADGELLTNEGKHICYFVERKLEGNHGKETLPR